jgi:hypothetical protein
MGVVERKIKIVGQSRVYVGSQKRIVRLSNGKKGWIQRVYHDGNAGCSSNVKDGMNLDRIHFASNGSSFLGEGNSMMSYWMDHIFCERVPLLETDSGPGKGRLDSTSVS